MAACHKLTTACRACGVRFERDDKRETCVACGESRKCGKAAVPGYKYCASHGGPAPSRNFYGLGGPIVTGEHSQFPITRLAAKYNQMQKDGPLLSTRHSIAIVRERIRQLAERIDLNEAPDRLARIVELWHKFTGEMDDNKTMDAMLTRDQIDREIEAAYHDYAAWKQMFEALDLDRKMVESEVKILKEIKAIITAEDAYELSAKLMAAVIHVEDDPKKLREIQYAFTRIIGDVGDGSGEEHPEDAGRGFGDVIDAERPGGVDREGILYPGDAQ